MVGSKVYYKAKWSSDGFSSNRKYLYLGEDIFKTKEKNKMTGKFVDNRNQIQYMAVSDFNLESEINEIKRVISLINIESDALTLYREYSCYKVVDESGVKKYNIMDNNYQESNFCCSWFITKEDFEEIKKQENGEQILKDKTSEIDEEMKRIKTKKSDSNNVKEVLKVINSYEVNIKSKQDIYKIEEESKTVLKKSKRTITALTGLLFLSPILMAYLPFKILYIIPMILAITLKCVANSNQNKFIENMNKYIDLLDKNSKDSSKELYYLPDEMLAKIKRIEILVEELIERNVDKDIIKLIKSNIKLSSVMVIKNETDESKHELIELLENSITYCNSLLDNKDGEKEYVKNSLAKNISDTIKNNNELIKSMIKDNDKLYKK